MTPGSTNMIFEYLQRHPGKKFTAREIAEWIFETYPDACREKQQRSTATVIPLDSDDAVVQQIIAEIGARRLPLQRKHPEVKTTDWKVRLIEEAFHKQMWDVGWVRI